MTSIEHCQARNTRSRSTEDESVTSETIPLVTQFHAHGSRSRSRSRDTLAALSAASFE